MFGVIAQVTLQFSPTFVKRFDNWLSEIHSQLLSKVSGAHCVFMKQHITKVHTLLSALQPKMRKRVAWSRSDLLAAVITEVAMIRRANPLKAPV